MNKIKQILIHPIVKGALLGFFSPLLLQFSYHFNTMASITMLDYKLYWQVFMPSVLFTALCWGVFLFLLILRKKKSVTRDKIYWKLFIVATLLGAVIGIVTNPLFTDFIILLSLVFTGIYVFSGIAFIFWVICLPFLHEPFLSILFVLSVVATCVYFINERKIK